MHKSCAYRTHGNLQKDVEACIAELKQGAKNKYSFTCKHCRDRMENPRARTKKRVDSSASEDSSSSSSSSSNSSHSSSSTLTLGTTTKTFKVSENGPAGIWSFDGDVGQIKSLTQPSVVEKTSKLNSLGLKLCPNCSHFM